MNESTQHRRLLSAAIFALATLSPAASVTFEAETGTLGADFAISNSASPAYITITTAPTTAGIPGTAARVATYNLTFPTAGTYQLYARLRVGADTWNNDSLYFASSLGTKSPSLSSDWVQVNGLGGAGFNNGTEVVTGSSTALGSGVWKWVNLSQFTGQGGFTVSAGNLTQSLQIGARELGLNMDKFVLGTAGYSFTVSNLDTGTDGTPPFGATLPLTITNFSGTSVVVGSNGVYSVSFTAPAWTFTGDLAQSLTNRLINSGADNIGNYSEITFSYTSAVPHSAAIRLYSNSPVLIFNDTTLAAGTNDLAFPRWITYPAPQSHLSFGNIFTTYNFSTLFSDNLWLYFQTNYDAFILSPATNYMVASTVRKGDGTITSGINSGIPQLPAGFSHRVILTAQNGINRIYSTWGNSLLALTGKIPPANDAAVELKKLGYWTDNGAAYYPYWNGTAPGIANTLLAVKNEFATKGVPISYLQLDSWWYKKGPNQVWNDPDNGFALYEPDPYLFTNGLAAFQQQLGLPLVLHNRWVYTNSPYLTVSNYAASGGVVIDPLFWTNLMTYVKSIGGVTYEQDWLGFRGVPSLNLNDPPAFLNNMANAAAANGINLQYCMVEGRDYLQGTLYTNLMTIRTSQDDFNTNRWTEFLFGSRLAQAVGIWPWSDVYMSGETRNLLLSTLSAGPVGPGDALGSVNAANLIKSIRPDGVIVKPDVSLVPVDDAYVNEALGQGRPLVATTYTDHANSRALYVFAYGETASDLVASFKPADFGLTGSAYVYDFFAATGLVVSAGSPFRFTTTLPDPTNGGSYFIAVPVGPSGIAFLGDTNKFVTRGRQRVASLSDTGTLMAKIAFATGETNVTLTGYAPTLPGLTTTAGSTMNLKYDATSHRFSFSVSPDNSGTAVIRLVVPKVATIDPAKKFQTIEGLGGATCFYSGNLSGHPYKNEIYTNLFAGLNVSMLRLGNWYRYQSSLTTFDSAAADIVTNASRVLGHPVPVYMSSWAPPAFLKSNGQVANGGTLTTNSDGTFAYAGFAQYWYDSLRAYQSNGISPTWISIQNEPDWAADYDSCVFHPTEDTVNGTNYASYAKALDAVYNKLTNLPAPPKLLAPEVVHIAYNDLKNYAATLNSNSFYGVNYHLYGGNDDDLSSSTNVFPGKPHFMTEFGVGGLLDAALLIHNCLTLAQDSGFNFWSLAWPAPSDSFIALESTWNTSSWTNAPPGTPTQSHGWYAMPSYWAMKHFSYFINPGYRRVSATDDDSNVLSSAYLSPEGLRLVVVAINTNATVSSTMNFDFGSFVIRSSSVFQTVGTNTFAGTNTFLPLGPLTTGLVLPPQSLTTIVLDQLSNVGAASEPLPTNAAAGVALAGQLQWTPGSNALRHAVYLGTSSNEVAQASPLSPQFLGLQTNNALYPPLAGGLTYFWRVDEIAGANTNTGMVWTFATAPAPALLHRYSFSETGGTTAADTVGGPAWAGTLTGGGTLASGQLTLASAAQQYASLPPGIVSTLTNFTIETWVKLSTTSSWSRIFDFGGNTTTNMFLTPQNGVTSQLRFAITTGGSGSEQQINGASALATGTWSHVAVTRNGNTGILYLNGVAVGTNNALTLKPASLGNTVNNYLGKSQYSDPYFNGALDEFRIYSVALSPAEIAATYALGSSAVLSTASPPLSVSPAPAGLTLMWPLANAGFTLQTRTNLTAGAWLNLTSPAPQIVGSQWQILLSAPGPAAPSTFYRLTK